MNFADQIINPVKIGFHFPIDKLTNSIEKVSTGESFVTEVLPVTKDEINGIHKKDGWSFNWKQEFREENRTTYKLVIEGDNVIWRLFMRVRVHRKLLNSIHFVG